MSAYRETACPICDSDATHLFFSLPSVPCQCGYLAPTRAEALNCTLGDIDLRHCRRCGHIWNSAFDPAKMNFNAEYDFSQYHSPSYRQYVVETIERLKTRYGLAGKKALDVACGKGDYLKMLIQAGFESAIGFDPTFEPGVLSSEDLRSITVHRRFYDERDASVEPDLITCRSALQYIPDPRAFLRSIRRTLRDDQATVLNFEVPNGAEAFHEKVIWYVMYEAGCFFSASSLARAFRESGFQVLDTIPALGSSQLEIEAVPSPAPTPHSVEDSKLISEIAADVEEFSAAYVVKTKEWSERFNAYATEGRRVVLWAAGMRAISLLINVPEAAATVEYVVDINPARQGRYLPKTGQLVVAPTSLTEIRPEVVIATNLNYATEIQAQLQQLGLCCDFGVLG